MNLKDKVRRSFSATRRFLDFTKIPLAETNKLFDSLFIPILLYGSEVWKIYKKDDFNTWEKDIIEEMHIFLCKQSLGVNKLCPNIAARNELGRLSLKLAIDANILKFYIHLQALPDNNIARQCLQLSVDMPEKTQLGMPPKIIKNLCDKYNPSSMILNMDNSKTFTSIVTNVKNIYNASTEHQLSLKKVNRKLNFYNIFKTDTKKAELSDKIKNPLHRFAISKLCLGNHSLYNETGRHTVPKTSEHLRICTLCQSNNIKTETHVLFSFTLHDALCSKLMMK